MSQEQPLELGPKSQELLKSFNEGVKSLVDTLGKIRTPKSEVVETKNTLNTDESQKGHKTIEEMVTCPECYPKLRDRILEKHRKDHEKSELECVGCGFGVEKEWEKCPICGGDSARSK